MKPTISATERGFNYQRQYTQGKILPSSIPSTDTAANTLTQPETVASSETFPLTKSTQPTNPNKITPFSQKSCKRSRCLHTQSTANFCKPHSSSQSVFQAIYASIQQKDANPNTQMIQTQRKQSSSSSDISSSQQPVLNTQREGVRFSDLKKSVNASIAETATSLVSTKPSTAIHSAQRLPQQQNFQGQQQQTASRTSSYHSLLPLSGALPNQDKFINSATKYNITRVTDETMDAAEFEKNEFITSRRSHSPKKTTHLITTITTAVPVNPSTLIRASTSNLSERIKKYHSIQRSTSTLNDSQLFFPEQRFKTTPKMDSVSSLAHVNTSQDLPLSSPLKEANQQSNIPYGFCKIDDLESPQSDAIIHNKQINGILKNKQTSSNDNNYDKSNTNYINNCSRPTTMTNNKDNQEKCINSNKSKRIIIQSKNSETTNSSMDCNSARLPSPLLRAAYSQHSHQNSMTQQHTHRVVLGDYSLNSSLHQFENNLSSPLRYTKQSPNSILKSLHPMDENHQISSLIEFLEETKPEILHLIFNFNNGEDQLEELIWSIIKCSIETKSILILCKILMLIGQIQQSVGRVDKSAFFYNQALLCADLLPPHLKIKSTLYKLLGQLCIITSQYNNAVVFYKKALQYAWFEKQQDAEIDIYEQLGVAYYYLSELSKSAFYHQRSISSDYEVENSHLWKIANEITAEIIKQKEPPVVQIDSRVFSHLALPLNFMQFDGIYNNNNKLNVSAAATASPTRRMQSHPGSNSTNSNVLLGSKLQFSNVNLKTTESIPDIQEVEDENNETTVNPENEKHLNDNKGDIIMKRCSSSILKKHSIVGQEMENGKNDFYKQIVAQDESKQKMYCQSMSHGEKRNNSNGSRDNNALKRKQTTIGMANVNSRRSSPLVSSRRSASQVDLSHSILKSPDSQHQNKEHKFTINLQKQDCGQSINKNIHSSSMISFEGEDERFLHCERAAQAKRLLYDNCHSETIISSILDSKEFIFEMSTPKHRISLVNPIPITLKKTKESSLKTIQARIKQQKLDEQQTQQEQLLYPPSSSSHRSNVPSSNSQYLNSLGIVGEKGSQRTFDDYKKYKLPLAKKIEVLSNSQVPIAQLWDKIDRTVALSNNKYSNHFNDRVRLSQNTPNREASNFQNYPKIAYKTIKSTYNELLEQLKQSKQGCQM